MENNEENSQNEIMMKLGFFEQQIRPIQQQLEAIEKGIIEMNSLRIGLDEFKGAKDKEILSQIGKNIFVRTKLISDELIVDIGSGNFIKKSIDDTKKLIGEQIKKLDNLKNELNSALEKISEEMTNTIMEAQNKKDSQNN
jgi:prefoldin alpha subunit